MSIMDIVAIGNKNWIKTEDGQWHHLTINSEGDAYLNGMFYLNGMLVPRIEITTEELDTTPSKKRWEILDFSI